MDYVNLASESSTNHIIFGEGLNSNLGGHLWPGARNKTPFPPNWSTDKIMHLVSDIATDPQLIYSPSQRKGEVNRFLVHGIRENANIRVVIDGTKDFITAYPIY